MKKNEVPQDRNPAFKGERKAIYALDETGHYATAPSSGWQVEAVVTGQAVAEYERLAQDALQRVRDGSASPLEFHMYDRRMELPTLAEATGLWLWRVRRHLRPGIFRKLSAPLRQRYAAALGLGVNELSSVPPQP